MVRYGYEYGRCLQEAARDVSEQTLSITEAAKAYCVLEIDLEYEVGCMVEAGTYKNG